MCILGQCRSILDVDEKSKEVLKEYFNRCSLVIDRSLVFLIWEKNRGDRGRKWIPSESRIVSCMCILSYSYLFTTRFHCHKFKGWYSSSVFSEYPVVWWWLLFYYRTVSVSIPISINRTELPLKSKWTHWKDIWFSIRGNNPSVSPVLLMT